MNHILQVERNLQDAISADMFGANNIFLYNRISGRGGTFDEAVELLNVTSLRFPGGTVTELYFDINNPDLPPLGFPPDKRFLGITEFLEFANSTGRDVNIVLPTSRFYTGTMDHRTNSPREMSQDYLENTLAYVERLLKNGDSGSDALPDARISAIQIGNEYWGIGLSEREYGQIVNALAKELKELFTRVLGEGADHPKIIVQMGDPWGAQYQSSDGFFNHLSWSERISVANQEIINAISDPMSRSAIDGLVEHYYSRHSGDMFSNTGASFTNHIGADFSIWSSRGFQDAELHITEWNVQHRNVDQFGLKGASLFIAQMEAMIRLGVDAAYAWPVQSATTDLAGGIGQTPQLTPIGAAFKLMSESLVGKTLLDSNISSGAIEVDVYGSENEVVFFVASRSGLAQTHVIEIDSVFRSFIAVTGVKISVHESRTVTDESAPAVLSTLDQSQILTNGALTLFLRPFEVIRITFSGSSLQESHGISRTVGTDSDEFLFGGSGHDTFTAKLGDDFVDGNAGNDLIYGDHGLDTIKGGIGADIMYGGFGHDLLLGEDGDDRIYGDGGNDTLWGGLGNDTLVGGEGADVLIGGAGFDIVDYTLAGSAVRVRLNSTNTALGDATGDRISEAEGIWGSAFDDTLTGDDGTNRLEGGGGNDFIEGWASSDSIFGGIGNDSIYGGRAGDILYGDSGDDLLNGNSDNDQLFGGDGNDSLIGESGSDSLTGGLGADSLQGGAGADTFQFVLFSDLSIGVRATDVIFDFERGMDRIDVSLIDASTRIAGNNAFVFNGTRPIGTSTQGEISYRLFDSAGTVNDYTLVYFDHNSDRAAEAVLKIMGLHVLTANDFLL